MKWRNDTAVAKRLAFIALLLVAGVVFGVFLAR